MAAPQRRLHSSGSAPGYIGKESQMVSSRGAPPSPVPGMNVPGLPAGTPLLSGSVITPEGVKTLDDVIKLAIQRAFEQFSVFTQSKPYDNYDITTVNLTPLAVLRLDAGSERASINRRALLICNTSAAAVLWLGKQNVNINNGIPVQANTTYLVAMKETVPIFGVINDTIAVQVVRFT